jgi:hypothetical protein
MGGLDLHIAIRRRSDGCCVVDGCDCARAGGGVMNDEQFFGWLRRQGKPESKALEKHRYGNPADHVKFDRETRGYMDRIKEMLREWAAWHQYRATGGYPSQSAFATERVQNNNRSTETYREMPAEIVRLDVEIERLAPGFKRILALEYLDRRPQKTKAALLGIPREVFSVRLRFVHEQLNFVMFGL